MSPTIKTKTVRLPKVKAAPPEAPPNPRSSSRVERIAALGVGESEALVVRLPFDTTTKEDIADTITRNKSTLVAAAFRAKAKTGGTYVTEVGDMRTREGEVLAVVAVTRTE